jgi:predicted porin
LENFEMKKSLVALAALAATSAFAQFSIDGNMDVGYQSINYKGNTVTGIGNNGANTSQINFRGTEDLGGGLKASFRVETDWNTVSNKGNTGSVSSPVTLGEETVAAASTFGNGEIRAGIAGGFGSINAGAVNYNTLGTYLTGQPFGTAIGSGFRTLYVNDAQSTSQVRSDNSLMYVSPSFSGLNVSVYYAGKQTKAAQTTASATASAVKSTSFGGLGAYDMQGTTELGMNYVNGPLAASYSSLKQDYKDVGTGTTESTVNTLGVNYAMGATKLYFLNQTNKTDTGSTNNRVTTVSIMHTMGAVDLMAQVGGLENAAGLKSNMTGLGANYNLSKTTNLYFRSESIDDKAGSVQAALTPATIKGSDTKWARTAVGIKVGF